MTVRPERKALVFWLVLLVILVGLMLLAHRHTPCRRNWMPACWIGRHDARYRGAKSCKYCDTIVSVSRTLEATLQALYDSEINVTITMLWDGGFDFALCSYMDAAYNEPGAVGWRNVPKAADLADALHTAAMEEYPTSSYAIDHRPGPAGNPYG